jgi:homeobox protein ESX1
MVFMTRTTQGKTTEASAAGPVSAEGRVVAQLPLPPDNPPGPPPGHPPPEPETPIVPPDKEKLPGDPPPPPEGDPPVERPPRLATEIGGPTGPEPTRYGDWERKGRVSDF